jgi:hypothetical protein
MLNKHITPAFRAALDADQQAVLGHFGALLANPPDPAVPEYLTAAAEPSTRAQLQARSRLSESAFVV